MLSLLRVLPVFKKRKKKMLRLFFIACSEDTYQQRLPVSYNIGDTLPGNS